MSEVNETNAAPPAERPRQLFMRRKPLSDLPPLGELPSGYVLCAARPSEEAGVAAVLQKAFPEMEWTAEKASRELLRAADVEAVYVVAHGAEIVATASARSVPDQYPGSGYLHWVGGDPAHGGKGFGRLVTLRVLHHFRDSGCDDSVLETDDFRLPAIKVYLQLGYQPEYIDPSHPARWAGILDKLNAR